MTTSVEMPMLPLEQQPKNSENDIKAETSELIKAELSKVKDLPTPVSNWEVNFDLDYDGDPSVYILATVEDDNIDEEVKYNNRIDSFSRIYELVAERIRPNVFVYVDLRAASEF